MPQRGHGGVGLAEVMVVEQARERPQALGGVIRKELRQQVFFLSLDLLTCWPSRVG